MNDIEKTISDQTEGALFRRTDLHIHSFGASGSYDVKDVDMSPAAIVSTAKQERLDIIAITDHNSIGNVQSACKEGEKAGLLVIPGVELSTIQGHLLLYFSTFEQLSKYFGQLDFSPDKQLCKHTIPQCLKIAFDYGGFGIAAHIDSDAGFEKFISGYPPQKADILMCHNLLAFEILNPLNELWYSLRDADASRRMLLEQRQKALDLGNAIEIAKVLFSDAHSLDMLGRNASRNKKITRLKMDCLSYNALRIALFDSTARVRIEDLIPEAVPRIIGIGTDGGFLDGQVIHFSKNLTCIIGGRGTGKSTLIESIRAASGNVARESLVDCDIWPDRISLLYEDQTGRRQIFCRDKCGEVVNLSDPDEGITHIPIESYGQGETAERIQHCDKNPQVLVDFLDDFVDFGTLKEEEASLRESLLQNQTKIERLDLDVKSIPEVTRALNNARTQLKTLRAHKASEIVQIEESLAKERSFRTNLVKKLSDFVKGVTGALSTEDIREFLGDYNATALVAGTNEFAEVKRIITNYIGTIGRCSFDLKKQSDIVVNDTNAQLKLWREKETLSLEKIEQLRKTLETQGMKLDMAFIRKTANDNEFYERKLKELAGKKNSLDEAKKERREILERRRTVRTKIFQKRQALSIKLTDSMRGTVIDYQVSIKFREGTLSPECQKIIQEGMGWRTSQVPRTAFIVEQLSFPALLDAIEKNAPKQLKIIKNADDTSVFSDTEAAQIITSLSHPQIRFKLEACPYEDMPEIKISRSIEATGGAKHHIIRNFTQLSLGQQQAVLLSILLFSDSNVPLIIDQPEDNLDNEFIYRTLVQNLRRAKERRQVIVVTHNANITVLGDAELIIPLKSSNEKGSVYRRGSIDNLETKNLTCEILEGGRQAFLKRKEIYGV